MNDEAFEWDEAKARSNRTKHGVDFETAALVFGDANAIEEYDARGTGRGTLAAHRNGGGTHSRCRLHNARESHSHYIGPEGDTT